VAVLTRLPRTDARPSPSPTAPLGVDDAPPLTLDPPPLGVAIVAAELPMICAATDVIRRLLDDSDEGQAPFAGMPAGLVISYTPADVSDTSDELATKSCQYTTTKAVLLIAFHGKYTESRDDTKLN